MHRINVDTRQVTPVAGFDRCWYPDSLYVQPGPDPAIAACIVPTGSNGGRASNDIDVIDLHGTSPSRILHPTSRVSRLRISADAKYLVALTDANSQRPQSQIEIWRLDTDRDTPAALIQDAKDGFEDLALRPRAELQFITTSGFSGKVQRWRCHPASNDLTCESLAQAVIAAGPLPSTFGVALSDPERVLYVGSGHQLAILDPETLTQTGTFASITEARVRRVGFVGGEGFFGSGFDQVHNDAHISLLSRDPDTIATSRIAYNLRQATESPNPSIEASSDDGRYIIRPGADALHGVVLSASSMRQIAAFAGSVGVFDRSGRVVAFVQPPALGDDRATICSFELDSPTQAPQCIRAPPGFRSPTVAVSRFQLAAADVVTRPDGQYDMAVRVWNRNTGHLEAPLDRRRGWVSSLQFSRDSKTLLIAGYDLTEWTTYPVPAPQAQFTYDNSSISTAIYNGNDNQVVAGYNYGRIRVFDRGKNQPALEYAAHIDTVESLAVGDRTNGLYRNILLSGGLDGAVRGWNLRGCGSQAATCPPLFSLFSVGDGRWFLNGAGDQFDTNSFDDQTSLSWIVSDDPLRPLPLEIFMRDYFEPGLLGKLLDGKRFQAQPSISTLNRVQPVIQSISVQDEEAKPGPDAVEPDTVKVVVKVRTNTGQFDVDGQKVTRGTGVYDVRLFRDGQLVAQRPEPTVETATHYSRQEEREDWRQKHEVLAYREDSMSSADVVFPDIRLPRLPGKTSVDLEAYAFNVDRVKSETVRVHYPLKEGIPPRAPRAYIITIGVNSFQDPSWNLRYAANDAWQAGLELEKALHALHGPSVTVPRYEKVVWIPLISATQIEMGGAPHVFSQAHKSQIEAVLRTLAGRPVDPAVLATIESARELRRANPEDLIIIVVSTHGMVDSDSGVFYFLPQDIGENFDPFRIRDARIRANMLSLAVSSTELTDWLRGVDAIDQVLIVDACHSAATVDGPEFKPGPLGSRGLGQLAFDKGMRVLAATQVSQDAVELDQTRMGLLVYAVIEDGLKRRKADTNHDGTITLGELLTYAKGDVPEVSRALESGALKGSKGTVIYPGALDQAAIRAGLQRPALFDFSRRDIPVSVANEESRSAGQTPSY
jgi:WD40 repeat protein